MAIAVENLAIGPPVASNGFATTIALTTNTTIAAGSFIVLSIGNYDSANSDVVTGVADNGPGLTWSIDVQGRPVAPSADNVALVSARAPAGMASGTVITVTFTTTCERRTIGGTSLTGVATSSPVDAVSAVLGVTSTAWSSPAVSVQAGSILFAVSHSGSVSTTSTITSPSIEAVDVTTTTTTQTTGYRIEASAGSVTVAGTYAASAASATIAAAYKAAAAATKAPPPLRRTHPSRYAQLRR